jgi:hypothetical protein
MVEWWKASLDRVEREGEEREREREGEESKTVSLSGVKRKSDEKRGEREREREIVCVCVCVVRGKKGQTAKGDGKKRKDRKTSEPMSRTNCFCKVLFFTETCA